MIETHISWIHINEFVYKIKKPIKLSFLDFSTLEKRRYYCEEEVRLNRRLSPDVYLGVVPVCEDGIEGNGKIIDYAVKMRKLSNKMDEMLLEGKVTESHIMEIAEIIAGFHKQLKSTGICDPGIVFSQIEDIKNYEGTFAEAGLDPSRLQDIIGWSRKEIDRLELSRRDCLECHGDLHSGNIFLDPLRIIDCIEFSFDFRNIDPASEVAFMAMDLDAFGRRDFSELFIREYVERTGDSQLIELLPLYKCYRANVRAKIAAIDYSQKKDDESKKRMEKYLNLAAGYASA